MRLNTYLACLSQVILFTACVNRPVTRPASPSASVIDADLRARAKAFSVAVVQASRSQWSRSTVDALAEFYTEDTIVFPPRGEPIRGRAAIRAYWTRSPDRRILAHTIRPERIEVGGDLVAEHGSFDLTWQTGDTAPQQGSSTYVSVWKRGADGVWRKYLDSWW